MNFNGRQLQEALQCMYDRRCLHTCISQNCGGWFLERETFFYDDNVLHLAWVDCLQKGCVFYFWEGIWVPKACLLLSISRCSKQIEAMMEDVQPLLSDVRTSGLLKELEALTKGLNETNEDLR